jgi:hypothetical protein
MHKVRVADTGDGSSLLDAHVFEKIHFQKHIAKLCLCLDPNDYNKGKIKVNDKTKVFEGEMRYRDLQAIKTNAQEFCTKFGIAYSEQE